jgi:hypothetical protein
MPEAATYSPCITATSSKLMRKSIDTQRVIQQTAPASRHTFQFPALPASDNSGLWVPIFGFGR